MIIVNKQDLTCNCSHELTPHNIYSIEEEKTGKKNETN